MSGLPYLAEQNKKEEIVRLLQNGADINEQDIFGETALYWACWQNHPEILQILLKNDNINVNLQNNYGKSPFLSACSNYNYECALLMIQDPRVDINLANNDGWSPLMWACYAGGTKTVQLLLSYGRHIDIYKKSTKDSYYSGIKSGSTALDLSKKYNRTRLKRKSDGCC